MDFLTHIQSIFALLSIAKATLYSEEISMASIFTKLVRDYKYGLVNLVNKASAT